MKIRNIEDLLQIGLQYMYDAELQLTEILPKMAQATCTPQLRQAFDHHLAETREHIARIVEIFKKLGQHPEARPNAILTQITHAAETLMLEIEECPIRDAALIVAGNQIEHFEIASYGSLRTFAQLLGKEEIVDILDKTLHEEKQADTCLTEIAQQQVNLEALHMSAAAGVEGPAATFAKELYFSANA